MPNITKKLKPSRPPLTRSDVRWRNGQMRRLWLGVMLLCLMATLTACGSYRTAVSVRTVVLVPPSNLTESVDVPMIQNNTNGGLLDVYLATLEALRTANARLESIREWSEGGGQTDE